MSSNERDPFPMTSPQAKRLEASLQGPPRGGVSSRAWGSMVTQVDLEDIGNGSGSDRDEASNSLVMKRKKLADKDDIYATTDDEINDEEHEDKYLDVPLTELRGPILDRCIASAKRFTLKLYQRLYGDKLPPSEMIRTLCLATTLFFMIGGYWLLRSLKDPVITALCGREAIPKAKILSVFVVLGVVSIYNHLLDSDIAKHRLFYIFGTFYFCLFILISLLLMSDTIGLGNRHASEGRILGWISYCGIESFGSVMVSLFWSFANSNITLETAKASYGVMVATAQVGSIIGPAVVNQFAEHLGLARCYMVGACCMLLLQGTMYTYISIYGTADERNDESKQEDASPSAPPPKKKEKAGIMEGLFLFWKYNYVKGIFAISCLFMVEVTIVDYTMKVLAQEHFAAEHPCEITNLDCYDPETGKFGMTDEATIGFTSFMGFFGVATNTLSFLLSLLGTSAVIRYLGLRLTLLLFPSLCLIVIIFVRLHPTLYVVFCAMMMLKACSYALNNPTKEMLYQPTNPAVKYKAKSWIDIFGARGSKAVGSLVTNAFSDSAELLVANGSLVGMAVASFLIWNARFMGKKFDEYTKSGYVVGEDFDPRRQNIEMAIGQTKDKSTSCGIYDDDNNNEGEDGDDNDDNDDGNDGDDDEETSPDKNRQQGKKTKDSGGKSTTKPKAETAMV